jgi:hypothetical protein
MFFDDLHRRIQKYFDRFPDENRVGIVIETSGGGYLMVDIIEYDERFITFAHWPLENADLPSTWAAIKHSLAAVTIPYEDIRAIEFDPKIVRGKEIGFPRNPSG